MIGEVHWEHNTIGDERFRLRTSRQGKRVEEGNDDLVNHPLQTTSANISSRNEVALAA
jgi:hypothetical protein